MSSPIELYLQCVESLETIHNQIKLEKKKLNIVGTDIKSTNKKIDQLHVNIIKITATANFKDKIFKILLNKAIGNHYFSGAESMLTYAFQNEKCGRSINFNGIEVYKESPNPGNNQYHAPATIEVQHCDISKDAVIAMLTFKTYDHINIDIYSTIYSTVKCDYHPIHSLYNQYKFQKIEETFINQEYVDNQIQYMEDKYNKKIFNLMNDINIIKETYDNQIKEMQQQNQQFKQILMENKLLPEPMPEYNYTDIAKRIKPFKRELIAITKWRKPIPLAVAIPVKNL